MCALQLDDLFKKKEAPQVLDLSRSVITSEEEFRRLLDKVPEYKIRPDKDGSQVRPEDIKVKEKDFTFHVRRRELRRKHEYSYADPCPPDMRSVKLEDLSSVNIDWKMLTSLRPRTRQDEDMFSRLVELSRLHIRSATSYSKGGTAETAALVKRGKNRAGILDTRVVVCSECGEEFCTTTTCSKFLYEYFSRVEPPERQVAKERARSKSSKKKTGGKKARSSRPRKRSSPRRHKNKSKSPVKGKRSSPSSRSLSRSPSKSPPKRVSKSVPRMPPKTPPSKGSRSSSESPSRSPPKVQLSKTNTKKQASNPAKNMAVKPSQTTSRSGAHAK